MKLRTLACLIGALAISSAPFVLAVTGGGFPSSPQFQYIGVGRVPSSGQTRIVTDNGGSGDSEIVIGSTTAGDTYLRTVPLGTTNWSAGTQRSSSQYRICNAVGMTGTCFTYTGAGAFTSPAGITASTGNISASAGNLTATATSNAQSILNTTTSGTAFYQMQNNGTSRGYFCLSITAGGCVVGDSINDVAIRGDGAIWFATATGGNQFASLSQAGVMNVKTGGDYQVNGTSIVGTLGACSFSATMAGTGTPTIQSNRGCSITPVRNSAGSYNFNASGISSGWTALCEIDSSSGGPYVFTAATNAGNTILVNIFVSSTGVLADPPSGAHVRCATGS